MGNRKSMRPRELAKLEQRFEGKLGSRRRQMLTEYAAGVFKPRQPEAAASEKKDDK